MQVTKIIAGHQITLEEGQKYSAARPMIRWWATGQVFSVFIKSSFGEIADIIPDLSYNQANEFLNEFNEELTGFEGRVW